MLKKLSIIIPVFNEDETLNETIERAIKSDIQNIKKEIIIIDDGSTDRTPEIIKDIKKRYKHIKTVKFEKNQGKGWAIRNGLDFATGDYVIIQDADMELDPLEYNKLLKPVLQKNAKVVFGTRFKNKSIDIPFWFYFANKLITFCANFLYGTNISDEACGFKLVKAQLLKSLNLKCKRFEFCPEVFAKVSRRKIKIDEVPVGYYPRKRKNRKKRINILDGIYTLWLLLYLRIKM